MSQPARLAERPKGPATTVPPDSPSLRPVLQFAALALPIGWAILATPVLLSLPIEPFALAATMFALLGPALIITARESGAAGVKRLLRDAVRVPRPSWWGLVALLAVPVAVWAAAVPLGFAHALTPDLLVGFAVALVVSTVIINIWEETVWTGFVQRRTMARWGVVRGSLATAVLFAGIHLPFAFAGSPTAGEVLLGVGILLGTGIGLRLIIAGLDTWSGRSLLAVGVLHGSFNATSSLVDPSGDWLRYAVAILFGIAVVVALQVRRGRRDRGPAATR
jgi:membrane protease YdiL (CAAX protease family)